MSKIYTEDLIRFLYNETTAEETRVINLAVAASPALRQELDVLKETLTQLDSLALDPHPTSVKMVLEESAKHGELEVQ
jgi:hypothetical protein